MTKEFCDNCFHAPSECPESGRSVFSIWKQKDDGGLGFKPNGKWWLSSDSETFYDAGEHSLEKQWEYHRDYMEPNCTMLAWGYEEEIDAFFKVLFWRTPQRVLEYIDTWSHANPPDGLKQTKFEIT